MPTVPVSDWGQAIMTSVASALALLLGAVPKVIGFAVILIFGWIIASALATAVAAILRTVTFNQLAQRAGFSGFVQKMGVHTDAAGFLATLVKWFVRLIVLVTAIDALGLPAVSQVLEQILLWLPNLAVALVELVIAGLAANVLAGLVRGPPAESGLGDPDMLATIARGGGMGLPDRHRGQPDWYRYDHREHAVHGHAWRSRGGICPGVRSRWTRDSRADRPGLVSARPRVRAEAWRKVADAASRLSQSTKASGTASTSSSSGQPSRP